MTLADREIETFATDGIGTIVIDPFNRNFIQPASYDVHLSKWFRYFPSNDEPIDTRSSTINTQLFDAEVFVIEPGEFLLASTIERIGLCDHIKAHIEGKSSLGRLGLIVHTTAGFIDPGFNGHITLELCNLNRRPLRLYAGMPIGQISFEKMDTCCQTPYGEVVGSKYQDAPEAPVESRYWKNFPDKILEIS